VITLYEPYRHHLLVTLTFCFILGLLLSFHFPSPSGLTVIIFSVCSLITLLLVLLRFNDEAIIALAFCFLLTGYWHGSQHENHPPDVNNISHLFENTQEAVLIGTLAKMVTGMDHEQKIIARSAYLRLKDNGNLIPVSGEVLLKLKGEWPKTIVPGESFIVRGIFKKPRSAKAAGLFDYKKYLAEKQIHLIGSVHSALLIHEINSVPDQDVFTHFSFFIEKTRTVISDYLSTTLPENHAALYRAVLLGDKSRISADLLDAFKRGGVAHILAISGMHMALLGFFLFSLFYYLTRLSTRLMLTINTRKLSMILCVGPLLFYSLLAGSNTPVTRSLIMSLMFILAFCVNRPKSHMTILAAAALIILIIDPLSLKSASFQLSFAAVASIILMTPRILSFMPSHQAKFGIQNLHNLFIRRTVELVVITISATIGTMPLLVYHFNQISTVTLPANIIVEPLICFWALPCGFLAVPLMFIHPPLAETVLIFGTWSLELVTKYIIYLSSIPFSVLWVPDIHIAAMILYYVSLIFIISSTSKQIRAYAILTLTGTLVFFVLPLSGLNNKLRKSDSVSFIDVGQGSSSLLQLAGGRIVLIDAGATTSPGFNCGEKIIAPYLWSQGIGRIDDIILTHADADHYNGISALLERFRPSRLWIPKKQSAKPGYHSLISNALKYRITINSPRDGIFISDSFSTLSVISDQIHEINQEKSFDISGTDNNDNSLIVSLTTRFFSILFPGDISASKEKTLIETGRALDHDILLSPHHGSSTSNSLEFLKTVNPRYMIVSARTSDNHLFPSATTRATAERLGITMLTTGQNGTVTAIGRDGGFEIKTSAKKE